MPWPKGVVFSQSRYRTFSGVCSCEAYQLRAQAEGHPFVVILDVTVPGGMGGQETIARLRALDPQVKASISSGYATDSVLAHYAQYGFDGVVAKPYTVQQVQTALQRVLRPTPARALPPPARGRDRPGLTMFGGVLDDLPHHAPCSVTPHVQP